MGSSTAVDATAKTFLFRKKIKKLRNCFLIARSLFLPLDMREFKRYKKKNDRPQQSQQTSLLGINDLVYRKIKCSFPKCSVDTKNVVIFDVHTCDHEDKILEALLGRC
jgi:hypothetical protein